MTNDNQFGLTIQPKLLITNRVLIRFTDFSVMAGKVLEVQSYGLTLEIEPTVEFKKGAIIFVPFSSIKYVDLT